MATIQKRKSEDGNQAFRVRVRLKGFPLQTATFERLTDAKKWAQHTEAAIREGRYFKTTEAKRHTLGQLVDRYVREVLPTKPRSQRAQKPQLRWWKEQLGSYSLADVTPALIGEYRDRLIAEEIPHKKNEKGIWLTHKRSLSTVVRYMAVLSHAFTIAVKEWGWVDDTPMRKVRKPTEPRGRVRFLSDEERARLLVACKASPQPFLYPVVVLALSTGMRRGEIMGLTWGDVDLQRQRIVLQETKNGERRTVPVVGHALEVMREHAKVRRLDTVLVFPGNTEQKPQKPQKSQKPLDIRAAWEVALRKALIQDFRFHDLRHSAASYLAMNGASLAEIADVLGHKTLQMVKRYAHLSEAHTSGVVTRMNLKIFG